MKENEGDNKQEMEDEKRIIDGTEGNAEKNTIYFSKNKQKSESIRLEEEEE